MYMYLFIYIHACIHIYKYTSIHIYIYTYIHIWVYIHTCVSILYLLACLFDATFISDMYVYAYRYDMDVYVHMYILRIDCIVSTVQVHVYESEWWCLVILTIHRDLSDLHHAPSCTKSSIVCIWPPSCLWARVNLAKTGEQVLKKGTDY